MSNTRLTIIAILTPRNGALESFRRYETRAASVMARYGGRIERTFVEENTYSEKTMREVHIITFPGKDAFERYRADGELHQLQDLRAECIEHTELLFGREGPDYTVLREGEV